MIATHDPWLVALSLIVAIQGAYVGLSLAVHIGTAVGDRRRLLFVGATISLALAIWTMHFVGMLAMRLPTPVDYLVFPTLLSFLVCIVVVGAAVFAVSAGPPTAIRLAAAAIFMGSGIASMHYIGMTALHTSVHLDQAPRFVVAGVAVGIVASALGLWLAAGREGRPRLLVSASAFGLAIAGMHYTAMAGMTLLSHDNAMSDAPAISTDRLAVVVVVVAFVGFAGFLLTLMPDGSGVRTYAGSKDVAPSTLPAEAELGLSQATLVDGNPADASEKRAEATQAVDFGLLPSQIVRHLPVQRDGRMHFLPLNDIVAIHANAHYTYVFEGTSKLFCSLSISDIERRLDTTRFVRVHRSHIINIERTVAIRRTKEGRIIELAAKNRYSVPVSGSRYSKLKSRFGTLIGSS
jgi:NO-binding membrane sensor protein with MHYT domain